MPRRRDAPSKPVPPPQPSEERFRTAIRNSPVVVFHQDRELRYTWIDNPPPELPIQSVVGKLDSELFEPEEAARLTAIKRRVLAAGVGAREEVLVNIQGQPRWYDLTVQPLHGAAGEIVEIACTAVDITDRKRAEERLRESEEQYRLLFEKNPNPTWVFDPQTLEFLAVNEAAVSHYGYSREEFLGMTIRDLRPREEVPALPAYRAGSESRGDFGPAGVWMHRQKDGTVISVEITRGPIRFRGRPAILVLARDVTDRLRTEEELRLARDLLETRVRERTAELARANEALRRSESTKRAILEAVPDAMFRIRRDGTYLDFAGSRDFATLAPPEEFLGKKVSEVMPPEVARQAMQAIRRGFETGEMQVFEYRLASLAGREHYEARIVVSGKNDVLAVVRDVSQRKEAEEALQASRAALQRTHDELRALTARLFSAEEDERRRISRELHDDWSQKLAVLALEVEELRKQLAPCPAPVRRRLEDLEARVAQLADDAHRLAYELHPSILDHLGLAVALRSYCQEFSRREGIPIRFLARRLPESIPQEPATCLYRLTQEALRNAARHARTERVTVSLSGSGGGLELSIRDTGVGFDPALVKGRGGLGILSMEERVRLVNGAFAVHSQPGRGTRIEVRVPLTNRERTR